MRIFTGQAAISAIAIGKLRFCSHASRPLTRWSTLSPDAELERFHQAQRSCLRTLAKLHDQAAAQVGRENASIFAIYSMLVEDGDYEDTVHSHIVERGLTAEYAVFLSGEKFASTFDAMEDEYMRARAADVRNVRTHLIHELLGYEEPDLLGDEPAILVDNEFTPSQTVQLDRGRTIALVARQGSVSSHAVELASAMHIPAAVQMDLPRELDGHLAILDGFDNRLYVDPTTEIFAMVEEKAAARYYAVK